MKGKEPFATFGNRKRGKERFFFIEFYSIEDINDKRISEKIKKEIIAKNKKEKYVLNLMKINGDEKIDTKIIRWIEESYKLV